MFQVNLKTLTGILGGTAAVTVITAGICALLKWNDDYPHIEPLYINLNP